MEQYVFKATDKNQNLRIKDVTGKEKIKRNFYMWCVFDYFYRYHIKIGMCNNLLINQPSKKVTIGKV